MQPLRMWNARDGVRYLGKMTNTFFNTIIVSGHMYPENRGIFRGALGHGPPLGQNFFFYIEKKLENLVGPLLCMSTSGQ